MYVNVVLFQLDYSEHYNLKCATALREFYCVFCALLCVGESGALIL